jgi:O-antigen/teichoic acid export membrane protein
MFQRLHARLGDFWWYSLMLFAACRTGDAIQAFIGLWLVPKYVGMEELGAVMPLQSLAGLFAAPLGVLAVVFAKYVNVYATRGETGKVKCLVRDVIAVSCLVFLVCIALALVALPHFYERLRVTAGLLTALILASGFVGNLATLFTNALQGLKKFKTMSVVNILGAPVRLVTLLVAMPFRPLSGYVLGQTTPPAATSAVAFLSLRRDFRGVACDTSWRQDLGEMLRYAGPVAVWSVGCTVFAAVFNTLIRQRMPEVESAAYYMLSRLAEIGCYLSLSIMTVLFPLAAEAHEKGQEDRRALRHAVVGALVFSALLSVVFAVVGRRPFDLVAVWRPYAAYSTLLPALTLLSGLAGAIGSIVTYEIACRRFATVWLVIGTNAVWLVFLVCFMGCEFFRGILPDAAVDGMAAFHLASLPVFTWTCLVYSTLQLLVLLPLLRRKRVKKA